MPEWLANMFSLTREISSKVALPIALATGAVLFLPEAILAKMGLDLFRSTVLTWIGAVFIISVAALLTNFLWMVGNLTKPYIKRFRMMRAYKANLKRLTEDEKEILREFIIQGKSTVSRRMTTGPINLLVQKVVVHRASSVSTIGDRFDYIMQPWAREYLEKKKHLLD